jgi:hypothetical protein
MPSADEEDDDAEEDEEEDGAAAAGPWMPRSSFHRDLHCAASRAA